jgi:ATP-dependent Lon protease
VDITRPSGLREVDPALGALPLFPLQTVLFPGELVPLHVFEGRYRAMVRDVLDGHRALSVVLVTAPERRDRDGHPAIARVAGVGVIVDHAERPDGRFDILVRGQARVRLDELPFQPPYRRARAEVLPSIGEASAGDVAALVAAATAFAALVRARDPRFELRLPQGVPGEVADHCAHRLVLDARDRQSLLEELDVGERVRRVAEVLALQQLALAPGRSEMN